MSQQRAQLVAPIGNVDVNGGIIVSGATTAVTFGGNFTGTATSISSGNNLNVGVITATSFFGDATNLTGIAATPFSGQNVTSVSGITTIDLSSGNVIYFTHDTDTTVAFANTSTTQSVTFIRTKDDTTTPRSITWPTSVLWSGGTTPTLNTNPRSTDAQQFNLLTRDGGLTWYAHQEVNANPQSFALYSWGINGVGALGQSNTDRYSSPVQIPGTQWSSIGNGANHSLATKTDGTLWSWGSNSSGELGQNNTTRYSSPVQIPGTQWSSVSGSGGVNNSLVKKTDGTLWAWGSNSGGKLGQNNLTQYSSPVQIPGNQWSSISGGYYSLTTKTDGTLWSWGSNTYGQLGQSNRIYYSSPVQIPGTQWSSIGLSASAGGGSSFVTKTDGTLWSWGSNSYGQLGQNNRITYSSPVQIPGTQWSSIGGSNNSVAVIKSDGTLWSWGYGTGLSQNDRINRSSPIQIPGTQWSSVSGNKHGTSGTINFSAIKTDGTLWAWGSNNYGQLGQSNTTQYSSPVQIPGTTWSSTSVGFRFISALQIAP